MRRRRKTAVNVADRRIEEEKDEIIDIISSSHEAIIKSDHQDTREEAKILA